MNYDIFYKSSQYYGADKIIKSYLKLDIKKKLPIVIPHGVDYYQHEKYILDSNSVEPGYICLRDDIYRKVKKTNRIGIKFPHPWVFLLKEKKIKKGTGTLFVAPPCSLDQYKDFYNRIDLKKFKKPWTVLIKDRSANKNHFIWWKKKGFYPVTAGNLNSSNFYIRLFDIINKSNKVLLCNMSSAGIFSASMGKKITFIENFKITDLDTAELTFPNENSINYLKVKQTWKQLFSSKKNVSKKTALFLLGSKYLKKKKLLKKEILKIISQSTTKPLYFEISNTIFYQIMIFMLKFNNKIIKLFPNPLKKVNKRLLNFLKLSSLNLNTISDFGYYKIAGKFEKPITQKIFLFNLNKPEPGHAPKIKKKN